jgi:hypothetical protein
MPCRRRAVVRARRKRDRILHLFGRELNPLYWLPAYGMVRLVRFVEVKDLE